MMYITNSKGRSCQVKSGIDFNPAVVGIPGSFNLMGSCPIHPFPGSICGLASLDHVGRGCGGQVWRQPQVVRELRSHERLIPRPLQRQLCNKVRDPGATDHLGFPNGCLWFLCRDPLLCCCAAVRSDVPM